MEEQETEDEYGERVLEGGRQASPTAMLYGRNLRACHNIAHFKYRSRPLAALTTRHGSDTKCDNRKERKSSAIVHDTK